MNDQASPSTVPDDTPKNMKAHPLGWKCRLCKKWLGEDRVKVAVTPQGQAYRVLDLIKAGQAIPSGAFIQEVATCTNDPNWANMPADHWCWQFLPNLEQ